MVAESPGAIYFNARTACSTTPKDEVKVYVSEVASLRAKLEETIEPKLPEVSRLSTTSAVKFPPTFSSTVLLSCVSESAMVTLLNGRTGLPAAALRARLDPFPDITGESFTEVTSTLTVPTAFPCDSSVVSITKVSSSESPLAT